MKADQKIAGILPKDLAHLARQKLAVNKEIAQKIRSGKVIHKDQLDGIIHSEHHRQFESIECLDCANCCKTTPALIVQSDMDRIASHLKISVSEFMASYVVMDEDGDFVFRKTPCVFLDDENKCQIYEVRPESCREYPMTLRKKQIKIIDVALANTSICPAVYRIFERLGREITALEE